MRKLSCPNLYLLEKATKKYDFKKFVKSRLKLERQFYFLMEHHLTTANN